MYSGFSDPYKARRIDKSHKLGHDGQTNTGASCTGKLHSQSGRLGVLIDVDACSCIQEFGMKPSHTDKGKYKVTCFV